MVCSIVILTFQEVQFETKLAIVKIQMLYRCNIDSLQLLYPDIVDALVLVNGYSCQASWTEWAYQKVYTGITIMYYRLQAMR